MAFIADIIGLFVNMLVEIGFLQPSQASAILDRFVMPIDDDMAL